MTNEKSQRPDDEMTKWAADEVNTIPFSHINMFVLFNSFNNKKKTHHPLLIIKYFVCIEKYGS